MNLTKLFKLTVFFGTLSLTLPVSSRTHATVPVITEASLLKEMIDRDALARLPYPAYVTKQFSSYDRKSIDPEKAGWYSNDDWSMFIRTVEAALRHWHGVPPISSTAAEAAMADATPTSA